MKKLFLALIFLSVPAFIYSVQTGIVVYPGGSEGDVQINEHGTFRGRTLVGDGVAITTSSTQIILTSTGTGNAAGPIHSIQFKATDGLLDGSSSLTYNTTAHFLTVAATTTLFTSVSTTQWTNVSTMTFGNGTMLRISSGAIIQIPVSAGAVFPDCSSDAQYGMIHFANDQPTGQQFFGCEGTAGWTLEGGGGGSSGSDLLVASNSWSGTNTFTYGVTAASFTASGSGVGVLTLKDSDGSNFTSLEASDTLTIDIPYVLPSSTGTIGYALTINGKDGNGKISTIWAPGGGGTDADAAHLMSTQTFSGTNDFVQTVNFTGLSTVTFSAVSTMTFNNVLMIIAADSTATINSPISLSGDYGTAGLVLGSNGPGLPVSWVTGSTASGGGGGGYYVEPATVTFNLAKGVLASTMVVSGFSNFGGTATFSGGLAIFQNISSATFNQGTAVYIVSGATLAIEGSMAANGSYGTSGQVLQSNGSGSAPSWATVSGGGSGGGVNSGTVGQMAYYAVAGTTVSGTSNLVNNTSSMTFNVTDVHVYGLSSSTGNYTSSVTANALVIPETASGTPSIFSNSHKTNGFGVTSTNAEVIKNGAATWTFNNPTTTNVELDVTISGINYPAIQDVLALYGGTNSSDSATPETLIQMSHGRSDGLVGSLFMGVRFNPGEDAKFVVQGSSFGTLGYAPDPNANNDFTVIVTTESSRYGFVGIGISTPTAPLQVRGHIEVSSTTPAVSSCGSSPSIVGNDQWGTVTVGGGVIGTCTITFAAPWNNAPSCQVLSNTAIASLTGSATTTAFTFTGTSLTDDVVMYHCGGWK